MNFLVKTQHLPVDSGGVIAYHFVVSVTDRLVCIVDTWGLRNIDSVELVTRDSRLGHRCWTLNYLWARKVGHLFCLDHKQEQ